MESQVAAPDVVMRWVGLGVHRFALARAQLDRCSWCVLEKFFGDSSRPWGLLGGANAPILATQNLIVSSDDFHIDWYIDGVLDSSKRNQKSVTLEKNHQVFQR